MFNVEFSEDVYNVDMACVFYPFKFGDFISLLYVCEAVRKFTGRNIKFSTTCAVNSPSNSMISAAMMFMDYFVPPQPWHKPFPLIGNVFVWQVYLYEFYNIFPKIKNNNKVQNRVVINPLMEGGARKWSDKLIHDFIDTFRNKNSILVGRNKYPTTEIKQKHGNAFETMQLIMESKYYIGGETGFTLFAGVVENGPEKIGAIYGPQHVVDGYKNGFKLYVDQVFNQTDGKISVDDLYTCYYPMTYKDVYRGYNNKTTGKDIYQFLYGGTE